MAAAHTRGLPAGAVRRHGKNTASRTNPPLPPQTQQQPQQEQPPQPPQPPQQESDSQIMDEFDDDLEDEFPDTPTPTSRSSRSRNGAMPKSRNPVTVMRQFVQHSLSFRLLRISDRVLIVVPLEFQIIGEDPSLHGRIAFVLNIDKSQSEAHVRLKDTGECVVVPLFYLCLEDRTLYSRLRELQLQDQQRGFGASDLTNEPISGPSADPLPPDVSCSFSPNSTRHPCRTEEGSPTTRVTHLPTIS